ncbi:DapH/DapD/GlmU-related protein [Segatella copri]
MIASKQDLKIYLDADRRANHISGLSLFFNKTWRYLKYMRKIEYLTNCRQGKLSKILLLWYRYKFRNLSVLTGISIPPNTFGKGLYIPHYGAIVVNGTVRFGDNCVIQNGVNVSDKVWGGQHCYLGAGAKILIGVHLGNHTIVGANAVVTKSFDEENVVLAGVPARIISHKGFKDRKTV